MAKILYLNFVENQKGAPAIYEDILANIPAPGLAGRLFVSTDTLAIYRDTGVAWDLISGGGGGGTVDSVSGAEGISVDNTDPANPIVELGDSADGSSVPFTENRTIDLAGNNFLINDLLNEIEWEIGGGSISAADITGDTLVMDINSLVFSTTTGEQGTFNVSGVNFSDSALDTSLLSASHLRFIVAGGEPNSILTGGELKIDNGAQNVTIVPTEISVGTVAGDPVINITDTDITFIDSAGGDTSILSAVQWQMYSDSDATIQTTVTLNDLLMQDSGGVDNMNLTELVLQFNNSISQSAFLSAGAFEMNDAAAAQVLAATCDLGFFAQSVSSGNQTMFITNEGFSWQQFSGGGGAYVTLTDGEMQFFDPTNNFINTIGADSQTMEDETTNNVLNLTPDSLFLSDALASFETLFTKQSGYIGLPSGSAALATFDVWGGGLSTNDPDTGTNDQIWEFGAEVAAAGVLDTTKYLAVWINGTRYQLATFT
jgi:hypothetical protein